MERQQGTGNGWALSLDDQDVCQLLPLREDHFLQGVSTVLDTSLTLLNDFRRFSSCRRIVNGHMRLIFSRNTRTTKQTPSSFTSSQLFSFHGSRRSICGPRAGSTRKAPTSCRKSSTRGPCLSSRSSMQSSRASGSRSPLRTSHRSTATCSIPTCIPRSLPLFCKCPPTVFEAPPDHDMQRTDTTSRAACEAERHTLHVRAQNAQRSRLDSRAHACYRGHKLRRHATGPPALCTYTLSNDAAKTC